TDVLAFATLDDPCPLPPEALELQPIYLGDIVISIETAQQQANQQGHSLVCELGWLASHGLLHLLGWDHPDDESLKRMLNQQAHLLRGIGLLSV
ncbi:MAG: rRNA maturation RNase YbeY, partial [Cyanobacteria bacterium]|nr:rRNA maturation RNase YbeY [Cyanobacteriota bacterium]MDW8202505.1 rRNA maturation RNase YbeY [Cyanobacteriota bacterium SKYGB_h_bin112]